MSADIPVRSYPAQTCALCGRHVEVVGTSRGFPPDVAKRKLQRLCKAAGCESQPEYRAGFTFPRSPRSSS